MLSAQAERGELARALAATSADVTQAWQRGWILAAMGRFAEALAALNLALDGPDRARALATRASVYRQLALHELAERDDDAALAATTAPAVQAGIKVGKVADALGLGLTEQWQPRLAEAQAAVAQHGDWRQQIRLAWVTGEVAIYSGDPAGSAPHFAEAITRSVAQGARRHEAKSHLFLAAAHASVRHAAAATGHAQAALALANDCGALPLAWAAALVLAEVGVEVPSHLQFARDTLAETLEGLPVDVRDAALARPPASWLLPDG